MDNGRYNLIEERVFTKSGENGYFQYIFKHGYDYRKEKPMYEAEQYSYGTPSELFVELLEEFDDYYGILRYDAFLGHTVLSLLNLA